MQGQQTHGLTRRGRVEPIISDEVWANCGHKKPRTRLVCAGLCPHAVSDEVWAAPRGNTPPPPTHTHTHILSSHPPLPGHFFVPLAGAGFSGRFPGPLLVLCLLCLIVLCRVSTDMTGQPQLSFICHCFQN